MKDTVKLIGPNGEGANVDAGSDAEKLYRGKGWKTGEEMEAAVAAEAAKEAEGAEGAKGGKGSDDGKAHGKDTRKA